MLICFMLYAISTEFLVILPGTIFQSLSVSDAFLPFSSCFPMLAYEVFMDNLTSYNVMLNNNTSEFDVWQCVVRRPGPPKCECNKVLLLPNNNLTLYYDGNLLAKFHQLSLLSIRVFIVGVTQPVVRFFLVYRT